MGDQLTVTAVRFQREKPKRPASGLKRDVEWELGVIVRGTVYEVIVDLAGEIVKPGIWNFQDDPCQGCLIVRE